MYSNVTTCVQVDGFNYFTNELGLRDRPFNLKGGGRVWFFVSFRIFCSDSTRVSIFFFCRAKREIFFQNLTIGYMTKTLNQIIFFSSARNFFPEFNNRLYDKNSNQIIFFSSARNFFPEFNNRLYDKNSESDYFFFLSAKFFSRI